MMLKGYCDPRKHIFGDNFGCKNVYVIRKYEQTSANRIIKKGKMCALNISITTNVSETFRVGRMKKKRKPSLQLVI